MKWTRLFLVTALLAGCRDVTYEDDPNPRPPGSRPDGGVASPDGSMAQAGTIRSILEAGTTKRSVAVSGAVVVGRVTSSKNAYAWIQDPSGGAKSGIQVYCQKENGCAAGYDIIDKLEEGDVIDVSGTIDVYMGTAEIITPSITKKGTKKAVAPTTVSADKIASTVSTGSVADLDQVLVKLDKSVTVSSISPTSMSRDCQSGGGKQYDGFEISVDGKTVNVGLGFYDTVGWCITACGFDCKAPLSVGDKFDGVQGVLRIVNGIVRIDPPWPANLLGGQLPDSPDGGTSPRPDAGPGGSSDAGAGSPDGGGGGTSDGTIESVTRNPPADGTMVGLDRVVVVGVETTTNSAQVYVQDLGGGEYSGLLLYCGTTCRAQLASLKAGDVIDARGSFKFFSGNTMELTDVTATPLGLTAQVAALPVSASRLAKSLSPASADFRPLNGVLVEVAGPLDVASTDVAPLMSSNTCTGGAHYLEGFEAAGGEGGFYVSFFFNDNVGSCLAGGCRTCDVGPITTAQHLDFVRGVARAQKGQSDPVVVVSPVDEIDFPRSGSVRSTLAANPLDGASVSVQDAVVVGYNEVSATKGSLFLQDAGGGRWSGIQLFCTAAACNDVAKTLVAGDVVDVSGNFLRYLGTTPEIESLVAPQKKGVSKALTMTIAGPEASLTAVGESAAFRAYNQVYVKVAGTMAVASLEPMALMVTCMASGLPSYEGFQVNDGTNDYLVADLFAPAYTLCVNDGCAECLNPVATDAAFTSVAGVARIGRGGRVQIAPTKDADLTRP